MVHVCILVKDLAQIVVRDLLTEYTVVWTAIILVAVHAQGNVQILVKVNVAKYVTEVVLQLVRKVAAIHVRILAHFPAMRVVKIPVKPLATFHAIIHVMAVGTLAIIHVQVDVMFLAYMEFIYNS